MSNASPLFVKDTYSVDCHLSNRVDGAFDSIEKRRIYHVRHWSSDTRSLYCIDVDLIVVMQYLNIAIKTFTCAFLFPIVYGISANVSIVAYATVCNRDERGHNSVVEFVYLCG